jgi:RNA polymerase sigma factor (sigma-70 family)
MADVNDSSLIQEYAGRNSESAFAALVQRHVNFVYSVAFRYVGNSQDAQDVTQAVFIILARKAESLRRRSILTGWLYETTRLTARQLLRTKGRQHAREQEAYMQSILDQSGNEAIWRQLAPHLEAAMSRLRAADRELLALRFYENKTGAEAAALLGIGAEAAHKRTNRALEKLRKFFTKRGVDSTAATIAETISANSVQAAPVALAKTVTAVAIAKGATASLSTLTLIKGALKIMAWTKMKTATVVGVAVIFATGTTTLAIRHEHRQRASDPMLMAGFSKSANQSLQGHWTGSNTAHRGQTCTVNISSDQIEYHGAAPKDWLRGTFVLNENSEPKQINVTILEPANSFVFGIYQVTGDKMTIAVAPHGKSQRPVNFTPDPQVDVLELQHD